MVNTGVVNANTRYFPPAAFCESFAVLGRIPRFQNPFKYNANIWINPETVHSGARVQGALIRFIARYQ
jgi:hypothetical protein